MTVAILFLLLFALMAIGIPIAISLGLAAILTVLLFSDASLSSLVLKLIQPMHSYTLLAIPFFVVSATFMTEGGMAARLVRFATAMVGHIKGGVAVSGVVACMLFAAVSGSSPATVVAVGGIAIAAMVQAGYTRGFAAGVICNAGTLGILVPPSIPLIVYASATETSVGRLFAAGLLPSLVLGLMLVAVLVVLAHYKDLPSLPRVTFLVLLKAFREALGGLLLIVVILGGIYGGVFTPTEAAAVAAVYAFVVTTFIYRELPLAAIPGVLLRSAQLTIMLMFIIANALLFSLVMAEEQIPATITRYFLDADMSWITFLVIMNIILIVAGYFMEPVVIILILAPIFLPIGVSVGIDPIHLGIIMVVNMEIGMVTPPMGLNLYVTSAVAKMDIWSVVKNVAPWLIVLFLFLLIVSFVPSLSLWLPNMLFGQRL